MERQYSQLEENTMNVEKIHQSRGIQGIARIQHR